jgi:hypothetical protein
LKTTDQIAPIARRHGLSEEAARMLWRALQASGGGLAQFDHPELGGEGQWMLGMTMIGELSNTRLKARVEQGVGVGRGRAWVSRRRAGVGVRHAGVGVTFTAGASRSP